MTKRIFRVLTLSIFFVSGSSVAYSCSCVEWSVHQKLRMFGTVFVGEVAETTEFFEDRKDGLLLANKVIFKVEKQWKGKKNREITIFVTFDSKGWCGDMNLAVGKKYLIYAYRDKDKLITFADCGPNSWDDYAKEEMRKLNNFWYRFFAQLYPYPKF